MMNETTDLKLSDDKNSCLKDFCFKRADIQKYPSKNVVVFKGRVALIMLKSHIKMFTKYEK